MKPERDITDASEAARQPGDSRSRIPYGAWPREDMFCATSSLIPLTRPFARIGPCFPLNFPVESLSINEVFPAPHSPKTHLNQQKLDLQFWSQDLMGFS